MKVGSWGSSSPPAASPAGTTRPTQATAHEAGPPSARVASLVSECRAWVAPPAYNVVGHRSFRWLYWRADSSRYDWGCSLPMEWRTQSTRSTIDRKPSVAFLDQRHQYCACHEDKSETRVRSAASATPGGNRNRPRAGGRIRAQNGRFSVSDLMHEVHSFQRNREAKRPFRAKTGARSGHQVHSFCWPPSARIPRIVRANRPSGPQAPCPSFWRREVSSAKGWWRKTTCHGSAVLTISRNRGACPERSRTGCGPGCRFRCGIGLASGRHRSRSNTRWGGKRAKQRVDSTSSYTGTRAKTDSRGACDEWTAVTPLGRSTTR